MPADTKKKFEGFSEDERAAMKARAKELIADAKANKNRAAGEKALLEAIAEMSEPDRTIATRIHELVSKAAPTLWPKTWYSMPAYAKDEKVVCFFQSAVKFKARYATLGFSDTAKLDEGDMWATSFGLKKLTPKVESQITELVKRAVS